MLAFGSGRADAVAASVEGPVAAMMPVSVLQHHPVAKFFLDEAASRLTHAPYYRWVYDHKPGWRHHQPMLR